MYQFPSNDSDCSSIPKKSVAFIKFVLEIATFLKQLIKFFWNLISMLDKFRKKSTMENNFFPPKSFQLKNLNTSKTYKGE